MFYFLHPMQFKVVLRDVVGWLGKHLRSINLWIHRLIHLLFSYIFLRANIFSFTDFLVNIFTSQGSLHCSLSNQGYCFEFHLYKKPLKTPLNDTQLNEDLQQDFPLNSCYYDCPSLFYQLKMHAMCCCWKFRKEEYCVHICTALIDRLKWFYFFHK